MVRDHGCGRRRLEIDEIKTRCAFGHRPRNTTWLRPRTALGENTSFSTLGRRLARRFRPGSERSARAPGPRSRSPGSSRTRTFAASGPRSRSPFSSAHAAKLDTAAALPRRRQLEKLDSLAADGRAAIRFSHDRDTTNGGHADAIPVADACVPYLATAMHASPSELVFPAADGSRRSQDTKLCDVLRRALGRAGVVTGYELRCRRRCLATALRRPRRVLAASLADRRRPARRPRRCPRRPRRGRPR
jgi:hypothetical protein